MPAKSSSSSNALALIEQQQAAELANIQNQISQPGASKLTVDKVTGQFKHSSGGELGTEIRVVIVDFVSANRWYPHAFRPDNPLPPGCFAFGKVLNDMAPDEASPEPQHANCVSCPWNQWESDRNGGKGKDCKNTREIAVILEDQFDEEEPEILVFSVPPTSIKNFDGFVSNTARVYGKLPVAVTAVMSTTAKGNYHVISFNADDENPNFHTHWALRGNVVELLTRPPNTENYVPSNERPKAGGAPAKRIAGARR